MKNMVKKLTLGVLVCVMLATAFMPLNVQAKSKGYGFKYSGKTYYMDDKADKLLEKLGDYEKRSKKKSCAYDGEDITYTYKNLKVKTYSNRRGGQEYIQSIMFRTDKVQTAEGIKIGSDEDDVKDAYNKRAKAVAGRYTFKKGKMSLVITVKNEKVTAVSYIAGV
ncbi:hypothetical protein AALB53_08870 [Lachnospiraceae bacterium 47-T17]